MLSCHYIFTCSGLCSVDQHPAVRQRNEGGSVCWSHWMLHFHQKQKRMICASLTRQGVTVYPHETKTILKIGQITVSLVNLCITLLHSNITVVYIVAYGFKANINGFSYLDPLRLAIGYEVRLDIGRNVKTTWIRYLIVRRGSKARFTQCFLV